MGLEIPPLRGTDFRMQNNGGIWQRRSCPSGNNPSNMPPPNHSNYRPEYFNGGANKKQNWNNRANKRNVGCREILPKKETYSSDSGFSSRSPTPSKNRGDSSQTESSDERDSVSSSIDQENKHLHEMNKNSSIVSNVNTAQSGQMTVATNQQYYPTQRNPPNYNNNANALRPQTQNYPGKKRYHTGRNSPPSQRNQKGRRFTSVVLPSYNLLPRSYIVAPDRFLARSHLVQVHVAPDDLYGGTGWSGLSHDIWAKFIAHQQTESTFKNKMMLWKGLYFYIKTTFPKYGLFLVGSTMNGFGSDNSDVDLCLLVRQTEMVQRIEAITHLQQLQKCLRGCDYVEHLELIKAKVPILKFRDYIRNLEVDLNCNNAVGIRNTHLLYCYSRIDWRVRPLVLVVKLWAQCQDINDAKNMTISSYSLVLMVIHFLQCGVTPCVLPCLHAIFPNKFSPSSDIHGIDIQEDLKIEVNPVNRQPLGELLFEFFKYYAMFDYSKYAISVRMARKMPIDECRRVISYKNDPYEWKYLCIEEPFDLTNTARSVYDYAVFSRIKEIFVNAYQRLKDNRDLGSIFVKTGPRMVQPYPHYGH
ncbi:poly(A) RNA polymerase gld-2 homolog A-like isoform X2 [Venturia canescens]|nr:poly(A) RNA polymerase gld-2 homolog A-like isoform X2 [Venturia canescens]